ncbi:Fc receptor-like protein 5 [Clarias gariepinus]|uniref:Fc receptor-like protein 5 n=1 Tax=Clarias gariepinus TaxID=13013 RepID=UPI00234C4537|nr:Fc receptor-like protein 5 [Clarias gariepinus]
MATLSVEGQSCHRLKLKALILKQGWQAKPKPTVSVDQSSIYTGDRVTLSCDLQARPKPTLTVHPAESVFIGESVTLTCEIQPGGSWQYHWYRDKTELTTGIEDRYTITDVKESDEGDYTCKGTQSSDPKYTETSAAVTLTVSEKPKPTVSVDQSSIYTGDRVTLSCDLQGPGWTFLFYEDQTSTPLSEKAPVANTHEVTISNVGQTTYYCKALRGNYESDNSDPATITVTARPQPVVKVHPAESVFTGESVTLTCEIQTDGSWQYHWYRDNKELTTGIEDRYTITDVKESNKGGYTCKGTQSSDPKYTETSAAVTLTVSEKPKPELTSSLTGDVLTGNSVTLTCTLNLQSYGWRFYWIKDTQSKETKTETFNFTTRSVRVSDGGQYRCRAGRGNPVYYTQYSKEFSLKVKEIKPVVIINPDTQVYRGERVTFRCNIQTGGDTEWTYSWYKNENTQTPHRTTQEFTVDITEQYRSYYECKYTCRGTRKRDSQISQISDPVTLSVSEKPKPVITSSRKGETLTGNSVTLTCRLKLPSAGWKFYWNKERQSKETETSTDSHTITPVRVSDGGQYKCRAGRGNPVYYTHYSDALWVNVIEIKPVVIITPDTQVYRGERVTFRCNIQTGGDTEWTYSWYKNENTQTPHRTTQEFTVDITGQDWSYYSPICRGTRKSDSQSSEKSKAVQLSVSAKPKPVITSSRKGETLTGNSVTLTCTLNLQSADWKFYWITPTQSTETETPTHSHTITPVGVSDGGQYKCRAGRGNPVYYTHYSDALWVNVTEIKPVVIINSDTQVYRGERVTFRCNIQTGGDTEWTYSWYENDNTQTPHRTTQEFTVIITEQDWSYYGGKYTCRGTRRSDSQISEMSEGVTLSVSEKPKPELTSDLKGAALTGNSVTLTCRLKLPSAGWKFYWIKDTQSNETETGTFHYFIRSVSVSDGGQYRCRAGRGNPVYYTNSSDALWVNVTGESPLVSLIISPSRTQHFTNDSLSLSCEDQRDSTGWTVRGHTNGTLFNCSLVSGSTCNISSLSTSHTGVYWCQSESGGRSNSLNITLHNGDVILESPVHPVTEGNPLTLRCLYRNTNISESGADFYKNDSVLQKQTTGEMTISSVSKSDEGFYHCTHPERGESPKSWVSVRVLSHEKAQLSVLKLLSSVVAASPYVLVTIILAVKCYRARTEPTENKRPESVIEAEASS